MLTLEQLRAIVPTLSNDKAGEVLPNLNAAMEWAEINTPARIGGFIAQAAHESAGFRIFVENLNYSAPGLLKTFKKYFTPVLADAYARKPQKIACRVYANRLGNGDEASGDGWKYRGKGAIQLTGKENHRRCGEDFDLDLVTNPELLLLPENLFKSAAWFWKVNNINRHCDAKDLVKMTKAVNGGLNGLDDRKAYYERAKKVLGF
jgi:putative chitinase